jgi:hypothetical protein
MSGDRRSSGVRYESRPGRESADTLGDGEETGRDEFATGDDRRQRGVISTTEMVPSTIQSALMSASASPTS